MLKVRVRVADPEDPAGEEVCAEVLSAQTYTSSARLAPSRAPTAPPTHRYTREHLRGSLAGWCTLGGTLGGTLLLPVGYYRAYSRL